MRLSLLVCVMLAAVAGAAERPTTGKAVAAFAPLDKAMVEFLDRVEATAGTIAVSRKGELVYSRGFGWKDEARKQPIDPDTLFRLASISKPFTSAAVLAMIRAERFKADDKALDLITIRPAGRLGDKRLKEITIQHLLDHKGGWDRDASFDPMFHTRDAATDLKLTRPTMPNDMVKWMFSKPLDFAPGEKEAYSNFGYCVLGRVMEAVEKKSYFDVLNERVLKPANITDVKIGKTRPDAKEVWYPVPDHAFRIEVMDAHGGLIASAPAVCRFLDAFWISGEPHRAGDRYHYAFFGSLPGTTTMARQRGDGVNVVVLVNNRRPRQYDADNDQLKSTIDAALDAVFKK